MANARSVVPGEDPVRTPSLLKSRMAALRHRGHGGGAIPLHRALTTLRVSPHEVAAALALAVALTAVWIHLLGPVCAGWKSLFAFGLRALGVDGDVVTSPWSPWTGLRLEIPYPMLPAGSPEPHTWWTAALATALLVVISGGLGESRLPLAYGLRLIALLQASALVYFALPGVALPYSLADFMADSLTASVALLAGVPLLLGFTYFLFDFGYLRKVGLTAAALVHLSVFIPLRYLLLGYLLHRYSLLYLPICCVLLGLPLDALVLVALYAWGMSWKPAAPRSVRPGTGTGERTHA